MHPLLYDSAALQHQDAVGEADLREPISDDKDSSPLADRCGGLPEACCISGPGLGGGARLLALLWSRGPSPAPVPLVSAPRGTLRAASRASA